MLPHGEAPQVETKEENKPSWEKTRNHRIEENHPATVVMAISWKKGGASPENSVS